MQKMQRFMFRELGTRVACAVLLGGALFSGVAMAKDKSGPPGSAFEGLWQGVDRVDGSELQMSIVRVEDGYEILLRDTFFSLCLMDGFTSGRGMDVGEGTLVDHNRLEFEFTLSCFADADPATPIPVNVTTVDLSLKSKGEVLVIEFEPEIYLHRVGK